MLPSYPLFKPKPNLRIPKVDLRVASKPLLVCLLKAGLEPEQGFVSYTDVDIGGPALSFLHVDLFELRLVAQEAGHSARPLLPLAEEVLSSVSFFLPLDTPVTPLPELKARLLRSSLSCSYPIC